MRRFAVACLMLWCTRAPGQGLAVRVGGRSPRAFTEEAVFSTTGFKGGLIVHLGCGAPAGEEGALTAALGVHEAHLVQGLDTNAVAVQAARQHIAAQGRYGRVSAAVLEGTTLPYVDNLVNLVVVSENPGIACEEIARVMAPYGTLLARRGTLGPLAPALDLALETNGWIRAVKRKPPDTDEWPQYLRGADNNAVSRDRRVAPPRRLQWNGPPRWMRAHIGLPTVNAIVSAGGRLFTIEDRGTSANPYLPAKIELIARDAFNGIPLWRQSISPWIPITRYFKGLPAQMQRRLAATRDRLYCTPGFGKPVTTFDAATGAVLGTFAGTDRAQEFAIHEGTLYVIDGDPGHAPGVSERYNFCGAESRRVDLGGSRSPDEEPFLGCGFSELYSPVPTRGKPVICRLQAFDLKTGALRWTRQDIVDYLATSLAVCDGRLVYAAQGSLHCLNATTGEPAWTTPADVSSTVVLTAKFVYACLADRVLGAYSTADGSRKWSGAFSYNSHQPGDLYVVGGNVLAGRGGALKSYDAETGVFEELKGNSAAGHERCYRNYITERFVINNGGGINMFSLEDKTLHSFGWVRTGCGIGVRPANGLLYTAPWECVCNVASMVPHFNALSSEMPAVGCTPRLTRGPAFGDGSAGAQDDGTGGWKTYRHDGERSGSTTEVVGTPIAGIWRTQLASAPSQPIIAGNRVYVAEPDAYSVAALDIGTGTVVWRHRVGGRVDSPPTYHDGSVIFGARDGFVHRVRASDGALIWSFTDLPSRQICSFGRLESAWPIHGSVLVRSNMVYFCAGRSSYLAGGMFVYGLDAATGEVRHRVHVDADDGGKKNDIAVLQDGVIHIQNLAFDEQLRSATAVAHVLPTTGFLDPVPHQRSTWRVAADVTLPKLWLDTPSGDLLVRGPDHCYLVDGFPYGQFTFFDPRVKGYLLSAVKDNTNVVWKTDIPLTGEAMALAADTLFVAGAPAYFPPDHPSQKYVDAYAGKLGGLLMAVSTNDGTPSTPITLASRPVWDGMAACTGRLFVSTRDGFLTAFAGASSEGE